ncbi:MAG TPA: response regulator [Bryobacteraceae bacterium]
MATILHIEDDDAMALAFRAAIEAVSLHAIVYRVSSGEAALAYLRGEGRYASRSWPDIAYVDLNMPKVDGWQVLVEMRADSELRSIPVVVVTASSRREDRDRAHALGRTSRSQPLLARCGGCYPINVSIAGA